MVYGFRELSGLPSAFMFMSIDMLELVVDRISTSSRIGSRCAGKFEILSSEDFPLFVLGTLAPPVA
ncbi:hypothetical protein GOP47_0019026 [Adiantum capillus-veneris]|uniref:Uncharacterized protein n=1 Tax=Adiantum capillus-veneris TaxID=13818 RepID=A0A9D4UEW8_ADICA|nr:hypothetical protein GOP47_0019026 [Adiantum capillus-veneris]